MGFSISWIAVKDRRLKQVIDELGLEVTNDSEEFPESDISGADLPNGWSHIQFNDYDSPFIKDDALLKISADTQVIFCQIEEHVMYSKSCCWENGHFVWSSEHDAQQDLLNITKNGDIPNAFDKIKQEHLQLQKEEGDEVDYIFDIPLVLAETITSVKHDVVPVESIKYQVLQICQDCESKLKPWWRFWKNITIRHKQPIAIGIMLSSLAGVFIIGHQYDLFGNKINFIAAPATYLFFGFILLGLFGMLYAFLRAKVAFRVTFFIAGLYFLIFMAGKLSRGEF